MNTVKELVYLQHVVVYQILKMKKAQISVEILFAIGFALFIFIILLAFTMERRYEVKKMEITLKEKEECYKLSNLISEVFTSGVETGMMETLKYDVEINSGEGSISVGEGEFFCTFPISAVMSPTETTFTLNKGSITLNNTNGTVVIQNA